MKQLRRRGFTIVELVIVIAVIGILATVLVPTFGDVIQSANQSKDIQTVKNMNTALAVYGATMSDSPVGHSLIQDIDDVLDALAQAGFDTAEELTPVCKNHSFYWHKTTNQIVYISEEKSGFVLVYPKDIPDFPASKNATLTNLADHAADGFENDQPNQEVSFTGLKVSILGDSISTFSGVPNVLNCVYPNSTVKTQSDTWWQQVIDSLGMELLVNNASGGSRVLSDEYFNGTGIRNGNQAAYRDRCVNLHSSTETPDVILVFLGTNDFSYHIDPDCTKCQTLLSCQECTSRQDNNLNVCAACRSASGVYSSFCNLPLGTASNVDLANAENPTSTCEAYAVMLHKMKQAYPDAQIFCLGLLPRVSPYQTHTYHNHGQPTAFNTELKQVVETYGATFIDLEQCVSNAAATWSTYFGDPVHPSAGGMDKITNAVVSAMTGKDLYTEPLWSVGAINSGNGTDVDSATWPHRIKTDFMDVSDGVTVSVVTDGSNAAFCPIFYNADKSYAYSPNAYQTDSLTVAPGQYAYMRLMVCNLSTKDDSSKHLTPAYGENIGIVFGTTEITWSVGAINSGNGDNADEAKWQSRIRTNFIDVSDGVIVSVVTDGSNAAFCPIFYNADKSYAYSPNAYQTDSLTVAPGQYAYMRLMVCNLSTKDDYTKHLTPDFGDNIRIVFR